MALSFALTTMSCGGGGRDTASSAQDAPLAQARPTALTDQQIAQLLYSGSPRTPEGFYTEAKPDSFGYVMTKHLKNTDVADVADDAPKYELCTNDWDEAFAWSEAAQQRALQYASLTATDENSRYFEFVRVRTDDPEVYIRERVFKCEYLDRRTNDLRLESGPAGTLHSTPVDAQALRALSEYLWQFTSYNNFGHAVLSSTGDGSGNTLRHTLLIANLERRGVSSTCDLITVDAWRHEAVVATGELMRNVEALWSFGAREANGAVELCD
jgi:hypothetical protein